MPPAQFRTKTGSTWVRRCASPANSDCGRPSSPRTAFSAIGSEIVGDRASGLFGHIEGDAAPQSSRYDVLGVRQREAHTECSAGGIEHLVDDGDDGIAIAAD